MRTIKFRVYDKLSKKYIQENSVYIMGALVNGVLTFCADDKNGLLNHHIIEQFTGLYDKNGKEIWEGDLVKDEHDNIEEIVFGKIGYDNSFNGLTGFSFKSRYMDYNDAYELWYYDNVSDYEVIGNIHEDSL